MARRPSRHRNPWKAAELKELKRLARTTTMRAAAQVLKRTPAAVQQKAFQSGISFR